MNGTVKWFNAQKGYGFIAPSDGSGDVFVHVRQLRASGIEALAEGQRVSYEIAKDRSGRPSASNVTTLT